LCANTVGCYGQVSREASPRDERCVSRAAFDDERPANGAASIEDIATLAPAIRQWTASGRCLKEQSARDVLGGTRRVDCSAVGARRGGETGIELMVLPAVVVRGRTIAEQLCGLSSNRFVPQLVQRRWTLLWR